MLSISYDAALLSTRRLLLEREGHDVVSAEGFTEALERCDGKLDLIILCHSIPQKDKHTIVARCRKRGCNAPVLSLLRPHERPIPEATHGTDAGDPRELLEAIKEILGERPQTPSVRPRA